MLTSTSTIITFHIITVIVNASVLSYVSKVYVASDLRHAVNVKYAEFHQNRNQIVDLY